MNDHTYRAGSHIDVLLRHSRYPLDTHPDHNRHASSRDPTLSRNDPIDFKLV